MTTDQITDEDGGGHTTRPFADILIGLNRGRTHDELSRAIQQLAQAVQDTRKKGSVVFTVTLTPGKADGVLELSDNVVIKEPKHERAASLFFADDDGNLVRDDPKQQTLPLRDISADPSDRPLRKAD